MTKFNPKLKHKRERLPRSSVAWKRRVDELYERENGICQYCGKWLFRNEAAPHHVKSVGSGGGDELENLILGCVKCHDDVHRGNIRLH